LVSSQDVRIEAIGETVDSNYESVKGIISVGGATTAAGISIESDNDISFTNRSGSHHLKIKSDQIEITDVNGLRISSDNNGVIISDFAISKWVHIPWE
jgi:hypothetical protein